MGGGGFEPQTPFNTPMTKVIIHPNFDNRLKNAVSKLHN